MSKFVHEIMNPVAFCVASSDPIDRVVQSLDILGIRGAPVVDDEGWPMGFFSRSDALEGSIVADSMSTPAKGIARDSTIETAAAQMMDGDLHHLVVVAADGRVCGFVSSIDVLRATLGRPKRHPATFPRWDAEAGVSWSDAASLAAAAHDAPDEPGVLIVTRAVAGTVDVVIWAQAAPSLNAAFKELAAGGRAITNSAAGALHARWATVPNTEALQRALRVLDRRVTSESAPAPVP